MDAELSKVAGEVRQLENEVMEAEQQYHELNMFICTADSKLQRAHKEMKCIRKEENMRHSPQYSTLSEQYTAQIAELDEQCKDLRKDKKLVEETHKDNMKQKKAYMALEKLMTVKVKVARQEMQNQADARYGEMGVTRTVMDASTAGVERLIIG